MKPLPGQGVQRGPSRELCLQRLLRRWLVSDNQWFHMPHPWFTRVGPLRLPLLLAWSL